MSVRAFVTTLFLGLGSLAAAGHAQGQAPGQDKRPVLAALDLPAPPSGPPGFRYLGVNLAGAEFGIADPAKALDCLGQFNVDYTYPTHAELDYYAAQHLNIVRVPFIWERMQPVQNGPLDDTQLGYLDDVVRYAARQGLTVIVDPHNYGFGHGKPIGSPETPDAAFANLWAQLAGHYARQPNVMFGLMNEPHVQSPADWVGPVNAAIAAIRATGAGQEILVPGTNWTAGDTWITSGNADFAARVVDPGHNMAFEIHQYSDQDGSGHSPAVVSPTIAQERLAAVTAWAQRTGNRLFLGEFGAARDPASLVNLSNMLAFMRQNADVWQGGTAWGGGPWWADYFFGTDPQNGVTAPQVAMLVSFAPARLALW